MERIKQALERAKQQRASHAPMAGRSGISAPTSAHQKITYTHTRLVKLEADFLKENRVISGNDDSTPSHYGLLRTKVAQRMRANNWQSLAITSPTEGAGKTLTAINLAISLARDVNQSVLLVDLDLKRPKLARYFTDEELPGITDYLLDDAPLSGLLFNPGVERLVILPGSKSLAHSSEVLASPKMVNLTQEMKSRYRSRLLIFDMPPVLACDDFLAFSPYFDASLLVVEQGKTAKDELKASIELLEKTELLGIVLNKAEGASASYGYY
jgi:capsular exopolysaccharide synthesis family protein